MSGQRYKADGRLSATSSVCKGRVLAAGSSVDHTLTLQNLTVVPVRLMFESRCRTGGLLSYGTEARWADRDEVSSGTEAADCTADFSRTLQVSNGAASPVGEHLTVKTQAQRLPNGPVENSVVLRHRLTVK